MSNSPDDPNPTGCPQPLPSADATELPVQEAAAGWQTPSKPPPLAVPQAIPLGPLPAGAIPVALPVAEPVGSEVPLALPVSDLAKEGDYPLAIPVALEPTAEVSEESAQPLSVSETETPASAELLQPSIPVSITCPICATVGPFEQPYCGDCGYHFSQADRDAAVVGGETLRVSQAAVRIRGRYELGELICERLGVQRYAAFDHEVSPPRLVHLLRQELTPPTAPPEPLDNPEPADDILPTFDDVPGMDLAPTTIRSSAAAWPSIAWERRLLRALEHPALPGELDYFSDETYEYLILEVPTGISLWDAWDDPDSPSSVKFNLLLEVVELLQQLHHVSVILQSIRPELFVIEQGKVRLRELSEILPIPLPEGLHVPRGLYTAPELWSGQGQVDVRADLYGFGALLYALFLGRELNEQTDFDEGGTAKLFSRFPDLHPGLGRLFMKTLRRQVEARFPTEEASREDATGFTELLRSLEVLRRTYDRVRLEIASWTSTGIVRSGNEDAFAVLHACESRQDDLGEAALIILCDGMGGYEAGEVAAALTIQSLRQQLIRLKPFEVAAGATPFVTDPMTQMGKLGGHTGHAIEVEAIQQALKAALKEANRQVFQASRAPGSKRRGMGCTAEVVYVDGRNVVVGHVGDSRTYHLHEGRLIQLTRDQTLVNRLVELGSLTAQEAETHPRRNELQQAIGGQPDVEPGLYHGKLTPGDWVVVCSDGLTNHVTHLDLQQMLLSEASSAQAAARRLINLTLIEGATDNVTVVVVRVT